MVLYISDHLPQHYIFTLRIRYKKDFSLIITTKCKNNKRKLCHFSSYQHSLCITFLKKLGNAFRFYHKFYDRFISTFDPWKRCSATNKYTYLSLHTNTLMRNCYILNKNFYGIIVSQKNKCVPKCTIFRYICNFINIS